jgi:hypothetical protein
MMVFIADLGALQKSERRMTNENGKGKKGKKGEIWGANLKKKRGSTKIKIRSGN